MIDFISLSLRFFRRHYAISPLLFAAAPFSRATPPRLISPRR